MVAGMVAPERQLLWVLGLASGAPAPINWNRMQRQQHPLQDKVHPSRPASTHKHTLHSYHTRLSTHYAHACTAAGQTVLTKAQDGKGGVGSQGGMRHTQHHGQLLVGGAAGGNLHE